MRLLIKNAKIFIENTLDIKDILIDFGEIIQIDNNIEFDIPEIIDAKENFVFPGLIDTNCNICDPGYEHREDILSVSKSAAKGGFTTIAASPNTMPVIDDKTIVKYIELMSKRASFVNVIQYGSMSKGLLGEEISEIGEMKKAGIVAISDGGKSIENSYLLNNVLKYTSMFDIPVITFCQDSKLCADGVMNQGEISTEIGLKGIPRESEEIIVARNIILAKYSNARIHISSVSTAGSIDLIRNAKKDGIKITCETSPHYFTLSDENIRNYNPLFKVNPPLRTNNDIEKIIEGVLDGTIDIISSGHYPTSIETKFTEFDRASYGISSLETTFLVAYNTLVLERKMELYDFIKKFTLEPSKLLGLEQKAQIKVGYAGDLFFFDENENTIIKSCNFASKAKFSPYENYNLKGKIFCTVVDGRIVYLQENN